MNYGAIELKYSEPFAEGMANDAQFTQWLIGKTSLADMSSGANVLKEEMKANRRNAKYWWRSYYTEKCRCDGCSGKETDLLVICENEAEQRFALHIEVKQPGDHFKADGIQSRGYPLRAQCWIDSPLKPKTVLKHERAATLLLCSDARVTSYGNHCDQFDAVITFKEVNTLFPHLFNDVYNSLPL